MTSTTPGGRWIKHARWSLLTCALVAAHAAKRQFEQLLAWLADATRTNKRLCRGFLLTEDPRLLYPRPDP